MVHDRFGPLAFVTSPPAPARDFLLVVSFARSAIHLDNNSVGLILQSVLGGKALEFRVLHQSSWIFRFWISSKNVGLVVCCLDNFVCKEFALFFSLWRDGGPDYIKEKMKWDLEQEAQWHTVSRTSKRSYADVAAMPSTPSASRRKNVLRHLSYPSSYYKDNFLKDPNPPKSVFQRLSTNHNHHGPCS